MWINNQLDINDMWESTRNGGKLTLWCVGISSLEQKRTVEDSDAGVPAGKKAKS